MRASRHTQRTIKAIREAWLEDAVVKCGSLGQQQEGGCATTLFLDAQSKHSPTSISSRQLSTSSATCSYNGFARVLRQPVPKSLVYNRKNLKLWLRSKLDLGIAGQLLQLQLQRGNPSDADANKRAQQLLAQATSLADLSDFVEHLGPHVAPGLLAAAAAQAANLLQASVVASAATTPRPALDVKDAWPVLGSVLRNLSPHLDKLAPSEMSALLYGLSRTHYPLTSQAKALLHQELAACVASKPQVEPRALSSLMLSSATLGLHSLDDEEQEEREQLEEDGQKIREEGNEGGKREKRTEREKREEREEGEEQGVSLPGGEEQGGGEKREERAEGEKREEGGEGEKGGEGVEREVQEGQERRMWEQLSSAAAAQINSMDAAQISQGVQALGRSGDHSNRLWGPLLTLIRARMLTWMQARPDQLAAALHHVALSGNAKAIHQLGPSAVSTWLAHQDAASLMKLPARSLVHLAHLCAATRKRRDAQAKAQKLMDRVCTAARHQVTRLTPYDLQGLLAALSTAGKVEDPLVHLAADVLRIRGFEGMGPAHSAALLASLADLRHPGADLCRSVLPEAQASLPSLPVSALANLAWAYAHMAEKADASSLVLAATAKLLDTSPGTGLPPAVLAQACVSCGTLHKALLHSPGNDEQLAEYGERLAGVTVLLGKQLENVEGLHAQLDPMLATRLQDVMAELLAS